MNDWYPPLTGVFSIHDSKVLSSIVKETKPRTILDLGPRQGRTTSVILEALITSQEDLSGIKYYLFEKDLDFLPNIRNYCLTLNTGIQFEFNENIIGYDFSSIPDLDFCFIDANHDDILPRWYVDTLFPQVKEDGIIHIHDIHYGRNGNGWEDVGLANNPQDHPDITSDEVHKRLYPTIYDKYASLPVTRFEEDIIKDYYFRMKDRVSFYSTCFPFHPRHPEDDEFGIRNCSLYIYNKKNEYSTFRS